MVQKYLNFRERSELARPTSATYPMMAGEYLRRCTKRSLSLGSGMTNQTEPASEFPRRVRALITYVHPFRMIDSNAFDPWSASIEQVNCGTWDYVKLHEIAGGIDVGLPPPYHMLIGRDGALALPPIPKLRSDQEAVEFFNRCLAGLLLGGIYCEAIGLDNLEFGSVIDWKYIRSSGGRAATNRFHELIRRRMAPPIEAILLMEPRTLAFDALAEAARIGFRLLKMVPHLSPEFLLKGVSGIARRDWGIGLSNFWITTEQLTELLMAAGRSCACEIGR